MLPNFIIFGAIKSGTGALYQYLSHHPQIYVSPLKEPRYFSYEGDDSEVTVNQVRTLEEYEQLFSNSEGKRTRGEASSNYINSRYAAIRIKETIPNVKLIASLRNPADRAYAHFLMNHKKTGTLDVKSIDSMRNERWATTSLYFEKLKIYYDLFPKEQIKVLIFENWTRNIDATLVQLYKFLEIDESFTLNKYIKYAPAKVSWPGIPRHSVLRKIRKYMPERMTIALNSLKLRYLPPNKGRDLDPDTRKIMNTWYKEDTIALQSLIGQDLSIWL